MHHAQSAVAAGLQRQMRMARNAAMRGHHVNELAVPIHGHDRADANFFNRSVLQDAVQQLFKITLRSQVMSPASQVNARDHHLAVSGTYQSLYLTQDFCQRQQAAVPSYRRNDAEGATVSPSPLPLKILPASRQ